MRKLVNISIFTVLISFVMLNTLRLGWMSSDLLILLPYDIGAKDHYPAS